MSFDVRKSWHHYDWPSMTSLVPCHQWHHYSLPSMTSLSNRSPVTSNVTPCHIPAQLTSFSSAEKPPRAELSLTGAWWSLMELDIHSAELCGAWATSAQLGLTKLGLIYLSWAAQYWSWALWAQLRAWRLQVGELGWAWSDLESSSSCDLGGIWGGW